MNLFKDLCKTYDNIRKNKLDKDKPLAPISHTFQNSYIHIFIDEKGNYKRASVEKKEIILPATEKSAGRTNGESPHPLADKIQYVAKDYPDYGGRKKSYFASYEEQLSEWCQSDHAHEKAIAVYKYISKGCVIKDLISDHILHVDEQGNLLAYWPFDFDKENPRPLIFKDLPTLPEDKRENKEKPEVEPGNALVCWSVEIAENPHSSTWDDESLQQSWADFDALSAGNIDFCYVTGQKKSVATNHPAKLRKNGDKAKLISANDSYGFTFRGRFTDKKQPVAIGYETTQKIHDALRWLISRQGYSNGNKCFVAWAISGKDIPNPFEDPWDMLSSTVPSSTEKDKISDGSVDHSIDLGESFAKKLKAYLRGYGKKLEPNEQIVVLGLDSVTPGRMSIIYYQEFNTSEFLKQLELWNDQFSWPQRYTTKEKEVIWQASAPTPKSIANVIHGNKNKLKSDLIKKIIKCKMDGQPLPKDIVDKAVREVCNRTKKRLSKEYSNLDSETAKWEKNLGITCSLYRGYCLQQTDNKRKDYSMTLERNRNTRDYLYGRLLAVATRIEEIALNVNGEKRLTNADRLMQQFANRPYLTWLSIELRLQPYMQRLLNSRAGFLTNHKKELDAVMAAFNTDDFTNDKALSGEFLLGYHCQRMDLRNKTNDPNESQNN